MRKPVLLSALFCLFCIHGFGYTITPGATSICVGSTVTECVSAAGGSWTSANYGVATVDISSGVVLGVSPGTAIISYSNGKDVTTCIITVSACCLTNSLVINTGYNPLTATADPGQAGDNVTPVEDPKWIVTAISADALSQIAAFGSSAVTLGGKADIMDANIPPYPTGSWAVDTTSSPSSWITAQNAHGYQTDFHNALNLSMTLSRPFAMCREDSIRIDAMIANDNYIVSANIDDTIDVPDFAFQAAVGTDPNNEPNHREFQHFMTLAAINLPVGPHQLNIVVRNYNFPESTIYNPTGMNLYGRLYSVTGGYTLVSERDSTCTASGCGINSHITTAAPIVPSVKGQLICSPNPNNGTFTICGSLPNAISGEATIEVMDIMGRIVYQNGAEIHNGDINKRVTLDYGVTNGVYFIKVYNGTTSNVMRVSICK